MNILDPNVTPITSLQPGDQLYVARPGPPAQDCRIDTESLEEQFGGGGGGGPLTINAQTGTTYTPVLADGDGNTLVTLANGANILVTIPTNGAVAYPVGTVLVFRQMGAGQVLIEGDTGVTINGVTPGDEVLTDAQYLSQGVLVQHATDVWSLTGWVE